MKGSSSHSMLGHIHGKRANEFYRVPWTGCAQNDNRCWSCGRWTSLEKVPLLSTFANRGDVLRKMVERARFGNAQELMASFGFVQVPAQCSVVALPKLRRALIKEAGTYRLPTFGSANGFFHEG